MIQIFFCILGIFYYNIFQIIHHIIFHLLTCLSCFMAFAVHIKWFIIPFKPFCVNQHSGNPVCIFIADSLFKIQIMFPYQRGFYKFCPNCNAKHSSFYQIFHCLFSFLSRYKCAIKRRRIYSSIFILPIHHVCVHHNIRFCLTYHSYDITQRIWITPIIIIVHKCDVITTGFLQSDVSCI